MLVRNPLKEDITIQYKGKTFTAPAGGEVSVPDEAAHYWQDRLHNFMELETETKLKKEVKVEPPAEITEIKEAEVVTTKKK